MQETGGTEIPQQHPLLLSVAEALHEAMSTPFTTNIQSPSLPEPHLPLRKASAQRLQQQSRRGAPRPIFAPSSSQLQYQSSSQPQASPRSPQHHQHHQHHVRGFQPNPVEPVPQVDNITASSEHAFAARDERGKRPFRMPAGVRALQYERDMRTPPHERPGSSRSQRENDRPPSSPLQPPPPSPSPLGNGHKKLRSSKSLGEGLRGLRHRLTSHEYKGKTTGDGRDTPDSVHTIGNGEEEVRQSLRSALTSNSSVVNASSVTTDRDSYNTGHSSPSDFVQVYPHWPETDQPKESFDVDDMIGMYEDGFESAKPSMDAQSKRSMQGSRPSFQEHRPSFQEFRPSSAQSHRLTPMQKRPVHMHRRSQSASLLDRVKTSPFFFDSPEPTPAKRDISSPAVLENGESKGTSGGLAVPQQSSNHKRTSTAIVAGRNLRQSEDDRPVTPSPANTAVPRDRYGFKKASHYITVQQYDDWDLVYKEHLDRRRKKWDALMRSYGLETNPPQRFPPKSDKIKRYVRKGVPPEWRGAAWWWYAGGPGMLAKHSGLYKNLLHQVENGALSDNDREHIERDLNRTFPDNVRFKPDPTTTLDAQSGAGGGKRGAPSELEVPIVKALRRVLQTFAVHNPSIGYCQSLNFLAGLLLLFLDENEERAFLLLTEITTNHLPGTHGVTLEGANIDIAVLMSCIQDSLPAVWTKLDDKGGGAVEETAQALRLPTVSLATTAWFMSLFVGTLPIECVLRVWDCLFFEGSKTLFRIALAIFKAGEKSILAVSDPMEIFQVVQTIPRSMLDVNALMEVCFRRRGGFGHVSQGLVESRRDERRRQVKAGVVAVNSGLEKWKGRWRSRTKG